MGALDDLLVGIFLALFSLLIATTISKKVAVILLVVVASAIFLRDAAIDWVHEALSRNHTVAEVGSVIYRADTGSAFATWLSPGFGPDNTSTDWKLAGDMLVSDGTKSIGSYIDLPQDLGRGDYAIEADIKVVRLAGPNPRSCVDIKVNHFGVYFREDRDAADDAMTGADYFAVTFEDDDDLPGDDCEDRKIKLRSYRIETVTSGPSTPSSGTPSYVTIDEDAFDPGTGWQTYRLEAKGNTLRLYVDGELLIQGTDNQFVSSGIVAFFSRNVELNVRNFKVTAL